MRRPLRYGPFAAAWAWCSSTLISLSAHDGAGKYFGSAACGKGYEDGRNYAHSRIPLKTRRPLVKEGCLSIPAFGREKQRVAIARALAMIRISCSLTKPTSALDPELTGEVLRTIKQLADENMNHDHR